MSDGPELLNLLAVRDGLRITLVESVGESAYEVTFDRVADGRSVGTATFRFHTGTTPRGIGAVLSQQIQAASGADPRYTPHVLADFAAIGYPDGSAGALRQLQRLLGSGSLYESYMGTYLDAAARGGQKVLEEMDCCFSGRAVEAMADSASAVAGQLEMAGTYTLASSPANRTSNAPLEAEHTAFTGALLRLLRHGAEQAPALLTLQAIYEHVLRELSAAGLPRPEQRNTRTAAGLALAPNHLSSDEEQRCRRAAASGRPQAMADLAGLLDRRGDGRQAALWHRKAAEAGHVAEMLTLGRLYRSVGQFDQARSWFRHAADAGSEEAKRFLDGLGPA